MALHYTPPTSGTIPISLMMPLYAQPKAPARRQPATSSANNVHDASSGTVTIVPHTKATRPMWMIELEQAAKRVRDLRPGWDGPGSGVVAESLIQRAVALVGIVMKGVDAPSAPYLMPAGDGSLQVEWDSVHAKLEFCLEPDGSLDFWSRDLRTGAELAGEGSAAMALFLHWGPWAAGAPDAHHDARPKDLGFFAIAA